MTVQALVDRISAERGPFFIARLGLRLNFVIEREAQSFREEHLRAIVNACRELGYDASPLLYGSTLPPARSSDPSRL